MAVALHLTSPPMRGARAVQTKLRALGYNVGPVDDVYGVHTVTAVKAFQRKHKLHVDGIVGQKTRAALTAAKPKPAPKPTPAGRSAGLKALAEAAKHVGVTEKPAGTNGNPFGRWFGIDRVPWCVIFMSYCFGIGADVTLAKGFKKPGCYPLGCTYVPTLEQWLRATGRWIGKVQPQPGDIAIFNWDGGVPDHVGIVEKNLGGGRFRTIEGNTAVGNDSNGGQVMRRERTLAQVDGFGRIR